MKKLIITLLTLPFMAMQAAAQAEELVPKEWQSATQGPLILYISGDGGFNSFSTDLCNAINTAGYNIIAVNARSYFWNKRTPIQTASDITSCLAKKFHGRKNQQLVLMGYSFGADVLPFIVNNLPDSIRQKMISAVLLSPSTSTDFQVHISDMLGGNRKRDMDVVAEINKMTVDKTVTISGIDENIFPDQLIKIKNYRNEHLPGGHTFDGNMKELVKTILKYL